MAEKVVRSSSPFGNDERFTRFIEDWQFPKGVYKYEQMIQSMALECGASLFIDWHDLYEYDEGLAEDLLNGYDKIQKGFNFVLYDKARQKNPGYYEKNSHVHVRFRALPVDTVLRTIGSDHLGKFIQVKGVVVRATGKTPIIIESYYKCPMCNEYTVIRQESIELITPNGCDHCDNKKKLLLDPDKSTFMNYQKITIQERPEELPPGQMPRSLNIDYYDDLVDTVRPGDRVNVVGTPKALQRKSRITGATRVFDIYLEGNNVENERVEEALQITEPERQQLIELSQDPWIFKRLLASIAPSIYGHEAEKESILYLLFSGVRKNLPDVTIRGDINVLLIGDPGTGKSQLLQFATKMAPRGIFTTGRGSSAAGLTAAVVRDTSGNYVLEAGALVLADLGVCCISEDSFLITPNGIMRMGEVHPSTQLIGEVNGYAKQSVKCVLEKGIKKVLRIKLYSGDVWEGPTPDHLVKTHRGWVEAGNLVPGDRLVIPVKPYRPQVTDQRLYELGLIHGFGLSDVYLSDLENRLSFSASKSNEDRSDLISNLIKKHYDTEVNRTEFTTRAAKINDKTINFAPVASYYLSNRNLKRDLKEISEQDQLPFEEDSYKLGFLAGILSTDTCISHKRGTYGIKHVIEIRLSREKYGEKWLKNKMMLVSSLFQSYGILATQRRNMVLISSLRSYNKCADLFENLLIGRNNEKLIKIIPAIKMPSYDDELNQDYFDWFKTVKFNTSKTVNLGVHSRIWNSINKKKINLSLMETLKPQWSSITNTPYREPDKNYLLNPILSIEEGVEKIVKDLVIDGEPNFQLTGGIVHNCIDELDKMKEEDRGAIHPAMEQQVVPIAKGGIVASLNARTSILASANPTLGRYNPYQNVSQNIDLPITILSRFDLIWVLRDTPDEAKDRNLAKHVMNLHMGKGDGVLNFIEVPMLRKYIAYGKLLKPQISEEASMKFENFYVSMRTSSSEAGEAAAISITARQLEGLIRLAEARAKAHLRTEVTIEDAVSVIALMQKSLEQVGIDATTGKVDIDLLYTGKPRSLQVQLQKVLSILAKLEIQSPGKGVAEDDLLTILEEKEKVMRPEAAKLISTLMRDGTIFSPRPGTYRRAH